MIFIGVALRNELGASTIGLSLVYSVMLSGMFQWVVRQSAEVENQMVSVERLVEYSSLEPEEERRGGGNSVRPPSGWPSAGAIELKDFSLRYDPDGEDVLRDINVSISPKEKIGIVGRTGAGKSSLIAGLFRLSPSRGALSIDGVEVHGLPLEALRAAISVIPQEPVLYSGSVRLNIDPFATSTDAEIQAALDDVQLTPALGTDGLDAVVAENGSNFSVGQRQLLCLARALLRPNRILVLDEATANIDLETDETIQRVIRTKCADWTVITIAHRLNTVMDADRILVLDQGRVAAFDTPSRLLKENGSLFAELAAHSRGETA